MVSRRPLPCRSAAGGAAIPKESRGLDVANQARPRTAGHDAFFSATLAESDPEIAEAIKNELGRQQHEIELIASENIVSRAVLEAQGSVMTNKYAEGYPGKRYYGGCEFVDVAETLAIERAKKLFGANFANVQPNSGSQMNQAVFLALLQPGDTFMGLDLAAGGHLTHGSPVNMSAASGSRSRPTASGARTSCSTTTRSSGSRSEAKPKLIIAGATAYSRFWDFRRFREIADSVGAYLMVDMAHFAGLVAGGVHPSPIPHAHVVTSTTHKSLRGPRGGLILTNDEAMAKKINSAVFPGLQGGPLMHVIAAKAVALRRGASPRLPGLCEEHRGECPRARRAAEEPRPRHRVGRHRQPPDACRSPPEAGEGQRLGEGAGARRAHLQQERHSVRSGKALRHLRHPARHAGLHDARLRRRRVPPGRCR